MLYLSLKTVHVLSMVLLFGTGLGTAWYKWMADRSGNLAHIAVTNRHVVLADWLFTTPTVILQPATGLWMAAMIGLPLSTPWLAASLVLYAIAGVCWLPESLARDEMETGRLVPASADDGWNLDLEIRLYRHTEKRSRKVEELWRTATRLLEREPAWRRYSAGMAGISRI